MEIYDRFGGYWGLIFSCVGFFVLFVGFGFIFGLLVSWVCYCLGFFFWGGGVVVVFNNSGNNN